MALDLLRQTLRKMPNDSLLWMSYGHRLQADSKYNAAYSAFTNAVEIDAGNFAALEQFVAMAEERKELHKIHSVLANLATAIQDRPHRYLESLNYSIPYAIFDALDIVAHGGVQLAVVVVGLHRADNLTSIEQLNETEANRAVAILSLCRGERDAALKALYRLTPEQIPVTSLRLAIRRASSHQESGAADKLLMEYLRARPGDPWAQRKTSVQSTEADYDLLRSGFRFPPEGETQAVEYRRNKVAYVLYNSLPYHSAGYSTRTHGLLSSMRQQGWDVAGVTRLGYPYDMPRYKGLASIPSVDTIDGVPYHRLSTQPGVEMKRPIEQYIDRYVERLTTFVTNEKPFLLHAASNHLNGLAAVSAARRLGLPSVYEVRGLWEITRASRDPVWATGPVFRLMARLEADAASSATHVIAITDALKDELIDRGVDAAKITVVPNGVDSTRFHPVERDQTLAAALEIGNRTVIGYVGSIVDYEGLGHLVEAIAVLERKRRDFLVLIVGDGVELQHIKAEAKRLKVDYLFRFCGRVPHEEVERYYSLIDITPFPRLPLPVCEMVSPLKPFEAMAMEKVIVASNVSALAEIVEHDVTGLLYEKNNVDALAEALATLLDDVELRFRLAAQGRDWVSRDRQWDALGERVGEVYKSLGGLLIPEAGSGEEMPSN